MNNNIEKIKAAKLSVYVGIIMFLAKIGAYFLTGSSAIFSDAAESVIHIIATSLALYSIILSSKPPDKNHLYGHGNVEFFSAGIEGLLIIVAAFAIMYFAVSDIITGHVPQQLDWGTIIIAIAGVVNLVLGFYLVKKGKHTKSLALIADGKHILTDSFTSIGVVIGLLLVMATNIYLIDPIVALLVGFNIIFTGYKLVRQSIGGLMKETDKELLNKISELLIQNKKDSWIDLHQLRFWTNGDTVFVDFHLVLPFYFNIIKAHEIETEIENILQHGLGDVQIIIHFDYCSNKYCNLCSMENCEFREQNKSIEQAWNTDKLLDNSIVSN